MLFPPDITEASTNICLTYEAHSLILHTVIRFTFLDLMGRGFYVEDSGGRPPPPPYISREPEEVLYFSTSLATWALQPTTASNNCYCVYE